MKRQERPWSKKQEVGYDTLVMMHVMLDEEQEFGKLESLGRVNLPTSSLIL